MDIEQPPTGAATSQGLTAAPRPPRMTMSPNTKSQLKCGLTTVFILAALLTVILVPLSLSSIEYYEYGLVRKRSTGAMRLDEGVYGPGRYHLGPDRTFKKYQADAHLVSFEELSVFSGDKLETLLDIDLIYFINKDQLVDLHRRFERSYDPVVRGRCIDAVKNTSPKFSTSLFFKNRTDIEDELFDAVKRRAKDVFVTVTHLYLSRVQIPDDVADRQLRSATQLEDNEKELNLQNALLIREATARLVNDVKNNATIVLESARATADLSVEKARVAAKKLVEEARQEGIKKLYDALNVTEAEDKATLDYIKAIEANSEAGLYINFDQARVALGAS